MSTSVELAEKHKLDAFLLKKWERVFSLFFDTNESKNIEWEDFYLVNRHVRDIYGADSEQMSFARESTKALWEGLIQLGDKNKDNKISLDEWIALMKSTEGKDAPWLTEYLKFLFKLFDVSADKVLDVAEYKDGMAAYGFSPEDAEKAFRKFAVNAKGSPVPSIDFTQFKKLWNEYFYDTNPNALGNYLFGCI